MSSIYEINKPYGSHQTYVRCRDNLNMVFREVEKDICKQWPSRMAQLGTDRLTEAAWAARGADGGVSWRTPSKALARHLFRRRQRTLPSPTTSRFARSPPKTRRRRHSWNGAGSRSTRTRAQLSGRPFASTQDR